MAVGATDKSVFLFSLQIRKDTKGNVQPFAKSCVTLTPIGFFMIDDPIKNLCFSPEDETYVNANKRLVPCKRIYVTSEEGVLLTVLIPNEPDFDTSTTYELSLAALKISDFKLCIPAKLIVPAPQVEENVGDQEIIKSKSNLMSQSMLSNSLNSLRKQKGLNITTASRFTGTYCLNFGFFVASIENQDKESEIRLFKQGKPEFSLLLGVVTDAVSCLTVDLPGKNLLIGTKHGSTTFISFSTAHLPFEMRDPMACPDNHETYADYVKRFELRILKTLEALGPEMSELDINNPPPHIEVDGQQWQGHFHDIVSGRINGLCSSFDSSFFMSAGADGGIFVWRHISSPIEQVAHIEEDHEEQMNQFNQAEDILETSSYSIQEEKLKSEQDKEIEAAENQKRIVLSQIQALREEFKAVISENDSSLKNIRLERSEMAVDPYLKQDVERDAELKKETLLKELAWEAEKAAIGPAKLHKKFLDPLQTERIEISAFKTYTEVSTFRTLKLQTSLDSLQNLQSISDKFAPAKDDLNQSDNKGVLLDDPNQQKGISKASKKVLIGF